ncbi:MAG: hypothetical protein CBC13_08570 [Planctomycetia bacterium TMED53]|nr:MAG: hypothetical protein CBC13_08570 [Planctomycetia bacterium TMED53]
MTTSDRFDPIVGNSSLIQSLWSFVLEVSDSRQPVVFFGEDGVGKKLAARKIHATGCIAGSRIRFLDGESFKVQQLEDHSQGNPMLNRAGTIYIGSAEKISAEVLQELRSALFENSDQIPRLVFGFRNEPDLKTQAIIDEMKPAGSFALTPLSQRPEDIAPIARYQIWSHSFKEDFKNRWDEFETLVLPDFMNRKWQGNVEELLEAVKIYCESSAESDGSRLVGEMNTSVSSHWLKEQFERMHEKLLDRWDHEDSIAASEPFGETWGGR